MSNIEKHTHECGRTKTLHRRNALVLFACTAFVWIVFDIATKHFFNGEYFCVGKQISGPYAGLFEFILVHNTGAAWGIFHNSTFELAIFSLIVCGVILVMFWFLSKNISIGETIGIALVFAGGLGNALDRFLQGYVIDFIHLVFIDFPVFNIADIGVTCGIVIFFVAFLLRGHESFDNSSENTKVR